MQKGQQATRLPLWTYKADIAITVDDVNFDGMAVANIGKKPIHLRSKAKLDLLLISSCHREFSQERVDYTTGWFGLGGSSSKVFTYTYSPTPIESEGYCPIYIQAFDRTGIAAWGFVAFRTSENLVASLSCNGRDSKLRGISVCQSRQGFEQGISFLAPVRFVSNDVCQIVAKSDREFRIRTKKMGFCEATFTDGKEKHRLVLLGYDEVLVRAEGQ